MKNLGYKFALIGVVAVIGLLAIYPPREKLKLGIDLSGGTILVYEVMKDTLPPGFSLDELIAALKNRIDPQGVREIPIRKLPPYRFEIILPEASAEEAQLRVREAMEGAMKLDVPLLVEAGVGPSWDKAH